MQEDIGGERIHLSSTSCAYKPCYIGKNLDVGENVSIGSMCHIGRNVTIGDGTRIQGSNYIADRTVIGSTVFIGPNSTILNDKYPPSGDASKWYPVRIETNAIIGGGCTILPGAHVGESAVLGGGSVLTEPLPSSEVWVGNPARFLMTREEYDIKE
ncbi:MAG: N-acetyltransferase [Euryarchaeota archaeon]|jgi:UDP-2-acetamido-3-amino-2,3-dideoxy-glucuronate N-acetyltransferase|nr:N-acetyltransferase [Euryarchaeota archaeon]MBF14007.1 N-acetyltransferase [Euryarchaeota archaeon]CAI8282725.1 MAG: dTDP-3-amino-3,6-dideoxy-alpha-D-galactopyranose 3-N-acetyltransferase [Euryarchaeota archaeon UBA443]|tara:strand:+ start:255 stop:722 length:468 start_codon:yes stop_codon:yes gene_type:complete